MSKAKVLFFAADPLSAPPDGHTARLLLDEDVRQIREKVRAAEHRDALEFDLRLAARPDDLLQALNETRPQVVHFSGHGESEGLVLAGANGRGPHVVDAAALGQLFELFRGDIRVVVLNACFSLPQAQAIAASVGCAIGTRSSISDQAAITFGAAFYRAIAFGHSVKMAYDQARTALALEHFDDRQCPELVCRPDVDPARLVLIPVPAAPAPTVAAPPQPAPSQPGLPEPVSDPAPEAPRNGGAGKKILLPQAPAPRVAAPPAPAPPDGASMYSLIVTAEEDAWEGRRYGIPRARFGEHTAESLRARFGRLDDAAIRALTSMPALLAYEEACDEPACVARITRVALGSDSEIRFDFKPVPGIAPISAEQLAQLRWELDITDRELNRTHWAIKEIDLMEVLREAGIHAPNPVVEKTLNRPAGELERCLDICPAVFEIPSGPRDPGLVAVMMPFSQEFAETYQEIRKACEAVGLRCQRADTIWEESTIMQDVFNLIYRSAVTIVDLSGRNPNVMYECGIAHTLGRPVLPISRNMEALPFDLAHHRVLAYLPTPEGHARMREKLESRLRSMTCTAPL
ncbi:MAG TPA: CHAT domain-containing protein [Longimicrobium sp.]|nr:CHAT domain-containing protein [Longimicrobium sp.]